MIIEIDDKYAPFLADLQQQLLTQDGRMTRGPIYCVYAQKTTRAHGWPESVFLTNLMAERFLDATRYRYKNPEIYVQSAGEDSELHTVLDILKGMKIKEAK